MSIFSDLKPTNHTDRNGFDLGRFSTFSTKAGYILPVFNQATLPDGEYSLDIKQLLRTQPLQKAAFTGFSVNYDVIWSPYNHLYSSFNQFIAQRENKNLVNQPIYTAIPSFRLGAFVTRLFCFAFYDYLLSFCTDIQDSNDEPAKLNLGVSIISCHSMTDSVALNVLRNLDMFDYGNFLPILKNAYSYLATMRFQYGQGSERVSKSVKLDTFYSANIPVADRDKYISVYQLLEQWVGLSFYQGFISDSFSDFLTLMRDFLNGVSVYEDVPMFSAVKPMGSDTPVLEMLAIQKDVSLFPPLAYNKAFYEYYRNTYYDSDYTLTWVLNGGDDFTLPYVQMFNLDDSPNFITFDEVNFMRLLAIFNVKPHLYKKDMVTGVMPSTQFGDVSMMFTDNDFHKLVSNFSSSASSSNLKQTSLSTRVVTDGNNDTSYKFDPALAISVLESRRADAMQRFKERMMRAGDKTKDIFKAHGWSEPKSELSFEPIFLGSFDGRMDINVVAATAESDTTELAQLGANGMCTVSGSKVHIKTSDFGVIQVLMHIEKDAVYDSYGVDIAHTLLTPFDFPYPVLQNISLAPVDRGYLNVIDNRDDYPDVLGYLPRAIGYKTALDKVHGEFFSSLPYEFDAEEHTYTYDKLRSFTTGAFSDWVAPREDMLSYYAKSFLYVNPSCVDTIFKMASNVRQDSDQFFVNCRFDCYAVEPLPVIGLPI